MKHTTTKRKQSGFFSLGLALGVIFLFGGTAIVVSTNTENHSGLVNHDSKTESQTTQAVKNDFD